MTKWLEDSNGNKCSVEYFGSEEKAKDALESLVNCKDCINCSGCRDCSYCSDCSGCSYCIHCSDCRDCSGCSYCIHCSGCSGCRDKKGDFVPPVVPKIENIHQKVYEAASKEGALEMGDWHTCNTTHCRAGWVVHLSGEEGYALERFHNTALAAQLIYRESGYRINPCRFYDGNEEALEDMKRLAELSACGEVKGSKWKTRNLN